MTELLNKTLSEIVTENYQAARVFEKYGLDFCCRGKRPLQQACAEKQVNPAVVVNDLQPLLVITDRRLDFNRMSLTELVEYIVRVHHSYVKETAPQIFEYVQRVAQKHGDRYPYMEEVSSLFSDLMQEMEQHMMKEEKILFPRIKQLELAEQPHNQLEFLQAPISVMEEEHESAGNLMQQIRELTNNYASPEEACTTHRLSIASLKAFEEDLHQHVHLENNILFPKAIDKFKFIQTTAVSQNG